MEYLGEILTGHGRCVSRHMVHWIVLAHLVGGFIDATEVADEARCVNQLRPLVGYRVRPFMTQDVGQAGVPAHEQVRQLCAVYGRDIDVIQIPAVVTQ